MLFGDFSIADAFFAPVCMRLRTYQLPVPGAVTDYIRRVCALPGVKAWMDDALTEHDFVDFDEALPHLPLGPGRPLHWAHAGLPVGGAVRIPCSGCR